MLKGICIGALIGTIVTAAGLSLYGYLWGLPYDLYCYGYFPAKEAVDAEIEEYIAQNEASRKYEEEQRKIEEDSEELRKKIAELEEKSAGSFSNSAPVADAQVKPSNPEPEPVQMHHWVFGKTTDSFDKKQTKRCILDAETLVQDTFGSVRPQMMLKQVNNRSIDIRLTIKNKVLGHPQDRDRVRLKFDNEEPFSVSFVGTADSSMDTIFLNSTSKVISKLKTAETLIIEVPFFMEGTRRITFNVSGYSEKCKF